MPDAVVVAAGEDLQVAVGGFAHCGSSRHGNALGVSAEIFPLRPIPVGLGLPQMPDAVVDAAGEDLQAAVGGFAYSWISRHSNALRVGAEVFPLRPVPVGLVCHRCQTWLSMPRAKISRRPS